MQISFWTPILWTNSHQGEAPRFYYNWVKQAHNFVDAFFHWKGREIALVHEIKPAEQPYANPIIRTELKYAAPIWWHTALKVATCFTLVIPALMLLAKAFFRALPLTYIEYIATVHKDHCIETGVFSGKNGEKKLKQGVRLYDNGVKETVVELDIFGWKGTRVANGVTEIGDFRSNRLREGVRQDQNSTQYFSPDILMHIDLLNEGIRLAIAKVKIDGNQKKIAAVQQSLAIHADSNPIGQSIQHIYFPYARSLNEALWKMGCAHSVVFGPSFYRRAYDPQVPFSILKTLVKEESFDTAGFYNFLFTSDEQGHFRIEFISEKNLNFLLDFLNTLTTVSLDISHKSVNGETLFAYTMKKCHTLLVKKCLETNPKACIQQLEESAGDILVTKYPLDACRAVLDFIEKEHGMAKKSYNLGDLVSAHKRGYLPILNLDSAIIERLWILFKKGVIVFESEGITKTGFLSTVCPKTKYSLFSFIRSLFLRTGRASPVFLSLITDFLEIDGSLVTKPAGFPYLNYVVNAGLPSKVEPILNAMIQHNVTLSPLEQLIIKIKNAPDMTKEELANYISKKEINQLPSEQHIILLRAAKMYKNRDLFELFYEWGIANSYKIPEMLLVKTFTYLTAQELVKTALVSTQWKECVASCVASVSNYRPLA